MMRTDNSTPAKDPTPRRIKVVSHSALLYFWPVWLAGFILGGLTYLEDTRLAVVPAATSVKAAESDKAFELTVPKEATPSLRQAVANTASGKEAFPVQIAQNKNYGVVYVVVVMLVIFAATVPLRGMASLAVVLLILLITLLFAYLDWWGPIFEYLGALHIQISLAGYLVPSVVLLVLWLGTLFLFDPLRYMIFTPGQFVVHKEIGDMKEAFDTVQIAAQKKRSDYLRHWLLGFGAGDLIIKLPGQSLQIELLNVMFVDRRLREIADLMKTKPVVNQ